MNKLVSSVHYTPVDSYPMWKNQKIFRNLAIITAVALVAIAAATVVFAALAGAAVIPFSLPIILGVGGAFVGVAAITFVALTVFTAAFYVQKSKETHIDAANKQMKEGAHELWRQASAEIWETEKMRQALECQNKNMTITFETKRLEANKRIADMIARDADSIKRKDELDKKSGELDAKRLQVIKREKDVIEEEAEIASKKAALEKEKAKLEETKKWLESMHQELVFGARAAASSTGVSHSKIYDFNLTPAENCELGNPLPAVIIKGREGVQWSFLFSEASDWVYLISKTRFKPLKETGCIEIDWTNEERATPEAIKFLQAMRKGGYDEFAALITDGASLIPFEDAIDLTSLYFMQISEEALRLIIRRLNELNVSAFTEEEALRALEIYLNLCNKKDRIGNFFNKFQRFHRKWLSDPETPINIRKFLETGDSDIDWTQERHATLQVTKIFRALRMNNSSELWELINLNRDLIALAKAVEIASRHEIPLNIERSNMAFHLGRMAASRDLTEEQAIAIIQAASYLLSHTSTSSLFDHLKRFHNRWRTSWTVPPVIVEYLAKR